MVSADKTRELENDSVDSDLLDEELNALQVDEVLTSRQKLLRCLQSNPVQVLLCVLVLLDAGIVIAQILLDLHSVREKLHQKEDEISKLLVYLKEAKHDELHGYTGEDVPFILQILSDHKNWSNISRQENSSSSAKINNTKQSQQHGDLSSQHHLVGSNVYPNEHGTGTHDIGGKYMQTRDIHRRTSEGDDPPDSEYQGEKDSLDHSDKMNSNSSNMHNEVFQDHNHHVVKHEEDDTLHEVAHGLHFASISILGFLVIEDFVKIAAMGKEFLKHKIEIFDAIIILASFAFDIIFLGGVTGEEGEKAAAVLVVLLLWRILRVVDGILITARQRQEFRIRLQKRARQKAEKKIDALEQEHHNKARQINALKDLCSKAGVHDEDIDACTPRRPRRVSNTVCALTSVARLSVSMTMSMSSGLFSMIEEEEEKDKDKEKEPPKLRRSHSETDKDDTSIMSDLNRFDHRQQRLHSHGHGQNMISAPSKMSDITEEELAMSVHHRGDSCIGSPVNRSGVRIVIDEGSDTHSSHSNVSFQAGDDNESIVIISDEHDHERHKNDIRNTFLKQDSDEDNDDKRVSQYSQIHLLAMSQ